MISANSSTTEPITEPSSGFVDFILRRLRITKLRAELVANQADATIVALSGGLISPEMAILILAECGVEVSS